MTDNAHTTDREIVPAKSINGSCSLPSDKSISHRALIFAAMATGRSTVTPVTASHDVLSTISCLQHLGVSIAESGQQWVVDSPGWHQWTKPDQPLDCGNSGTTMRLLSGCLAPCPFESTLTGDESLTRRPMQRIAEPLRQMGADIVLSDDDTAPICIRGRSLHGIIYEIPIASAQVKSAVLLAGMHAQGTTCVLEKYASRDHTERMLAAAGVECSIVLPAKGGDRRERLLDSVTESDWPIGIRRKIVVDGQSVVNPGEWSIPGDISAAAFFIAAAVGSHKSRVTFDNVGLNPTRNGFIKALRRMGAVIEMTRTGDRNGESIGTVDARSAYELKSIKVGPADIPSMVDELAALAVIAGRATGVTVIRGADELRHKESDRIAVVSENLRAMGVKVAELEDGWAIEGPTEWKAATVDSHGDHRIAMAFAIAALWADGTSTIQNAGCAAISNPEFFHTLDELTQH